MPVRNLLSLIGLVIVVFLGLGWYLGWYQLGISTGESGNTQISFDVNTNKIKDDGRKGLSRAGEFVDSLKKEPVEAKNEFVGPTLPSNWNSPSSKK
jgi:hypothetical protein